MAAFFLILYSIIFDKSLMVNYTELSQCYKILGIERACFYETKPEPAHFLGQICSGIAVVILKSSDVISLTNIQTTKAYGLGSLASFAGKRVQREIG